MKQARPPFRIVEHESVEACPPGVGPREVHEGDFILTHGKAPFSRLIRFGQTLRIHGDDRQYTYWNHAALVISRQGDLVEAHRPGVRRSHLGAYRGDDYRVVHVKASSVDREKMVRFAEWSLAEGHRLGRLTFASIALSLLTGTKLVFHIDGSAICSELVARAQERSGAIFSRAPAHVMPADLAKYYEVVPPQTRSGG